jgi:hypothetical protein
MPNEILRLIISEVRHLPSLSAVARTSFLLFENASPILFKTMHLRHPDQLKPFFAQVSLLSSKRQTQTIACSWFLAPCSLQRPSNRLNPAATLDHVQALHFYASPNGPNTSLYPPLRLSHLRDLHIHTNSSSLFNNDQIRSSLPLLDPIRLFWKHAQFPDGARRPYGRYIVDQANWNGLTARWFSLTTFVLNKTTLRLKARNLSTYLPLFSHASSLSPTRQHLRVVFDLGTSSEGFKEATECQEVGCGV